MTLPSIAISKTKPVSGKPIKPEPTDVALILFGRDEGGKPHAAWFAAADEALARKAAGLMGMHALQLADDQGRGLAAGLPKGKVFASGRAFVPFVKTAAFAALAEAAGVPADGPNPPRQPAATDPAAGSSGGGKASEPHHQPKDWGEIKLGSLVLATEGAEDGWYESVVVEVKPDDLLVLRWRDWPELPVFPRRREHLGLLHPKHADA